MGQQIEDRVTTFYNFTAASAHPAATTYSSAAQQHAQTTQTTQTVRFRQNDRRTDRTTDRQTDRQQSSSTDSRWTENFGLFDV